MTSIVNYKVFRYYEKAKKKIFKIDITTYFHESSTIQIPISSNTVQLIHEPFISYTNANNIEYSIYKKHSRHTSPKFETSRKRNRKATHPHIIKTGREAFPLHFTAKRKQHHHRRPENKKQTPYALLVENCRWL